MGDTVNLRQFRKRKNRQDKAAKADANRKLHGISSKQRKSAQSENVKNISALDAHRLDKG